MRDVLPDHGEFHHWYFVNYNQDDPSRWDYSLLAQAWIVESAILVWVLATRKLERSRETFMWEVD